MSTSDLFIALALVMALQPSLRALIVAGRPDAPHTLDIFRKSAGSTASAKHCNLPFSVDYVCPFR